MRAARAIHFTNECWGVFGSRDADPIQGLRRIPIVEPEPRDSGKLASIVCCENSAASPGGADGGDAVERTYSADQSSSRSPFTRENSRILPVARTAPRLRTVPAISRSSGPIV